MVLKKKAESALVSHPEESSPEQSVNHLAQPNVPSQITRFPLILLMISFPEGIWVRPKQSVQECTWEN